MDEGNAGSSFPTDEGIAGSSFPTDEGTLAPSVRSFPLRGGRRALTLHATGLRHAASWLGGGESFISFEEITDVAPSRRGLRIGTLRNVLILQRRIFLDANAPEELARELLERIAALPGGSLQLARMAEVDQLARRRGHLRATGVAIAICLILYVADLLLAPEVQNAGHFGATLFFSGEHWRLLTGNFLHGGLAHVTLNALGLWVLGALVERPLGTSRTTLIMAVSAVGAMGAGAVAGYEYAVGASGIVCGLAGAALALELQIPAKLPAAWRIPRRLFLTALLVDGLLSIFVPVVAGMAHLGGFAAGGLCALALLPRASLTARSPAWVRSLALAVVLLLVSTAFTLGREISAGPEVLARRAERLLALPSASPTMLNNTAWMIVTSPSASREQLQLALRSAERAVEETNRTEPNFLDTLAEAQFRAGLDADALGSIDEAIALAPHESYYLEQRRRFTGERAYDDRPAPPSEPAQRGEPYEPWLEEPRPWQPRLPPGHPPIEEDPGISV